MHKIREIVKRLKIEKEVNDKIMSKKSSSSGGISFIGLVTILFIGLKLTNHIAWSWWWVLAPIWIIIPILIVIVILWIIAVIIKKH